jgi:hypothetical protein
MDAELAPIPLLPFLSFCRDFCPEQQNSGVRSIFVSWPMLYPIRHFRESVDVSFAHHADLRYISLPDSFNGADNDFIK